eukprot:Phypoly_transcript_02137.p2 GENE.Phypoly_transcript_02137~~Phypoly_transcript_02137.p2  ORF type:complete len:407 (-),score=82.27 Phypoly_transcript_02137:59-1279(-)
MSHRNEETKQRSRAMQEEASRMKSDASAMRVEAGRMNERVAKMKQDMKDDADRDEQKRNKGEKDTKKTTENEEDEGDIKEDEPREQDDEGGGKEERERKRKEQDAATYLAVARRQYQNRIKGFSQKDHKCAKCWLINECCVCDKIAPVSTKHEYIIYMHQLEYLRGSNTGKILLMADPKTKLYISGQDNEKELFDLLKSRPPNRVMCLMPKDSVSVEEFIANAFNDPSNAHMLRKEEADEQHDGLDYLDSVDFFEQENSNSNTEIQQPPPPHSPPSSSPSLPPLSELPVVTVCVLDGTWKQVKALLNRLPEITKVHLPIEPDGIKSLLTPVRQQSTPDRICTLQATIIAMQHLGESPELCESLTKSLKHFMNSLLRQGGRKVKYDADDATHSLQEVTKEKKKSSVT